MTHDKTLTAPPDHTAPRNVNHRLLNAFLIRLVALMLLTVAYVFSLNP